METTQLWLASILPSLRKHVVLVSLLVSRGARHESESHF